MGVVRVRERMMVVMVCSSVFVRMSSRILWGFMLIVLSMLSL